MLLWLMTSFKICWPLQQAHPLPTSHFTTPTIHILLPSPNILFFMFPFLWTHFFWLPASPTILHPSLSNQQQTTCQTPVCPLPVLQTHLSYFLTLLIILPTIINAFMDNNVLPSNKYLSFCHYLTVFQVNAVISLPEWKVLRGRTKFLQVCKCPALVDSKSSSCAKPSSH